MKLFNPMQYIAIDIGNCYGLDKLNYQDRIDWVKQNLNQLEDLQAQAEEPYLYYKAVRALRDAQAGKPTNHTVALDAASSGLQLMSVMMRDLEGCITTGLCDNRMDAYTVVTDEMNRLMKEDGLEEVYVSRKQAKEACMTSAYGSVAVPKKVFGEDLLPYFYEAMKNKFNGAMILLDLLLASWNSNENYHSWIMPDNHFVYIPTMEAVQKKVTIKEINYHTSVQYHEQVYKDKGVANAANVIHSVDSYVLRCLVRRCNYNKFTVENFMAISGCVAYKEVHEHLYGIDRYKATKMADIAILEHIQYNNISHYPKELIEALRAICETMLVHEPFELICIHDSFACSPVNCNYLRQHYNNILAELSDSDVIVDLLNQLYQTDEFDNPNPSISDHIRNSSYGIC